MWFKFLNINCNNINLVYNIVIQSFGGLHFKEIPMALGNYVAELKKKHAKLSDDVDNEQKKQFPDMTLLSILKKQKLKIKEKLVKKIRQL